jgi:chromosome segregation ATPase
MEVLSWITDETGENPLQRERDELLEARRACGERLIEVTQERDEARWQTEIVESYLEAATGKLAELIKERQVLGAELAAVKYARDELIAGKFAEEPLRRQIAELREKVGAGDTANREQSLQKLGARLAELLDEDHFAECEAFLLAAGVKPYAELRGAEPPGGASLSNAVFGVED